MHKERELVYMWKTSIPPYILKRHIPVKHVSQLQRPENTLDFLRETQRYIAHIRHPELGRRGYTGKKRIQTAETPEINPLSPKGNTDWEANLMVRARSWDSIGNEKGKNEYVITRYMPVSNRLSPRLGTTGADVRRTPNYLNGDIDKFMHRFEPRHIKPPTKH